MNKSDSRDSASRSADLRTRIAAALKTAIRDQAYTLILLEDQEPYSVLIDGTVDLLEVADAVIRELNLAKPCESGCVWQIPRHVEDMTPKQRELLAVDTGKCQDPWHQATGEPYQCPTCGQWMGETKVRRIAKYHAESSSRLESPDL